MSRAGIEKHQERKNLGHMAARALTGIAVMALACLFVTATPHAQTASGPNWNPVEGPPSGAEYVGEKVCATCHVQEAESYKNAAMNQAGQFAADAEVLRTHPLLTFKLGPYHYRIVRRGTQSIYSVSDGKQTISAPILWAFGRPDAGQSYVLRRDGAYYQAEVSYFVDISGLGITSGEPTTPADTLEKAFGQRLPHIVAQQCIACHTTGAVVGGVLNPQNSMPGVTCEACHGPGGRHVEAMKQGKVAEGAAAIFNPARLNAYNLDDFCGACHRTWEQIMRAGPHDIGNVRFQPYRLELSACWSATDPRISCLACHNPHEQVIRKTAFYDSKCLACHNEKGVKTLPNHPGAACPVATHDCVQCHMARYKIPSSHAYFFDHNIRVVHPGAPYPD